MKLILHFSRRRIISTAVPSFNFSFMDRTASARSLFKAITNEKGGASEAHEKVSDARTLARSKNVLKG